MFERGAQHHEVASVSAGLREASDSALEVADAFQRLSHVAEDERIAQQIADEILPLAQHCEIAERMQDPVAQFPRAHRRVRAVEAAEQRGVARAAAALRELEVRLRRGVHGHELRIAVHSESRDVAQRTAQLLEVLQDRARGTLCGVHFGAAETVERLHAEMFAQRVVRLLGEECVALARLDAARVAVKRDVLLGHEHLGGLHAREFVGEFLFIGQLGEAEISGREIKKCKPVPAIFPGMDRGEVIVPLRIEHLQIRDRAGRDDVRDFALHDLPRLRLAHLIADGHALAGLDEPAHVILLRVVRDAAHRRAVPLRERDIEYACGDLRIVEEHLVKIAEPEQQQRVRRQGAPDAVVLLHHRCECLGHCKRA